MDQVKIGKFIAQRRKRERMTQAQLAEKMNVTDRAVSKWETGKSMPDSSIMLELCGILNITVNDLLSGEVVSMENYDKELENNLLEAMLQKEELDRRLLRLEIVLGVVAILPLVIAAVIASVMPLGEWECGLMVGLSLIPLLVAMPFAIWIEQKTGYYECGVCGHRHVPKYGSVFFAMHVNRTRYMRCPKCGKRSWQKKVVDQK